MTTHKTEKLVRDCFCGVVCTIIPNQTWQSLARAARRFVKLEQAAKARAEWKAFRMHCRRTKKLTNDPQEEERKENNKCK